MLVGQLTAVDLEAQTITVEVRSGNRLVEEKIGLELTVLIAESTKIREYGAEPGVFITLDQLVAADQLLLIRGHVRDDVFTAELVVVDIPCTCEKTTE